MNVPWPMYLGFLAAIVGNIFWCCKENINKANGHKISYWTHSSDFKNFKEVIAKEVDLEKKRKFKKNSERKICLHCCANSLIFRCYSGNNKRMRS